MSKRTLMLSIVALLVSLCASTLNVFGAADKYTVPLVQSGQDVYISAEITLLNLNSGVDSYKTALDFNNGFIETAKTGDFDKVKSLYYKEDGSQEKFEEFRNDFDQSNVYKSIDNVKYNEGIAWGDFRFIAVDYTYMGRVINFREDLFCPSDSMCKKSMRDFGQPFEFGYIKFIQERQSKSSPQKGPQAKSGTSKSFDKAKTFDVILPDSSAPFDQNTFKITIGVNTLKSDVCVDCESAKNGVLKSEEVILRQLVEFAHGLDNLDDLHIGKTDSLMTYINKFDKNHEKTTGFPILSWDNGKGDMIVTNVVGYLSRIKQWKGGVPLGYIESDKGIYVFVRFDDGASVEKFDMEIFFLKKELSGEYNYRPVGNKGSIEQTLIKDPFILGSLKNLFLDQ